MSAQVGPEPCPHCGKAIAPGQTYMCDHCGGRFDLRSGQPTVAGSQPPTRLDWRRLPRHPAFWFGAVGLPLMVAVGWLWLQHVDPCFHVEGTSNMLPCQAGSAVLYGPAMGLAFWYVAGLAWDWPVGLVGPAAGVLVAVLASLPVLIVGGEDVASVGIGSGMVAAIGMFAYPLGLLARWLVVALPIVGLGCGGFMLVLGISLIVDPTTGVYDDTKIAAFFAPAMLLAGGGTLAVGAWLMLGGRHAVPASLPTADDRADAGRRKADTSDG